jgi:hypothetical protein
MNFIFIILSIIIIILLFVLYRFLVAPQTALVTNLYLPNSVPDIPLNKLKIKDYGNYTIDFWIYVNSLPSTNNSYIGTDSTEPNNHFGLNGNQNGFIFQTSSGNLSFDLYSNSTLTFYNGRQNKISSTHPYYPSVMTNAFPIQKWTYIIVSVRNNSLIDLYINGKLTQSTNYDDKTDPYKIIKPISSESLQFGKKLDAYITKLYMTENAMNTKTAYEKYLQGNGSVSNLNVKLHLTQNSKISNTIKLL